MTTITDTDRINFLIEHTHYEPNTDDDTDGTKWVLPTLSRTGPDGKFRTLREAIDLAIEEGNW